ncbi:hypothetical protein N7454_002521 [Penicillium verhagenii]|nr:hypothetical protein N7454_002521 [Penicillium verhagenii]
MRFHFFVLSYSAVVTALSGEFEVKSGDGPKGSVNGVSSVGNKIGNVNGRGFDVDTEDGEIGSIGVGIGLGLGNYRPKHVSRKLSPKVTELTGRMVEFQTSTGVIFELMRDLPVKTTSP